jgi:hypothetical protein
LVAGFQGLDCPVVTTNFSFADLTIATAIEPFGRTVAMRRQDSAIHAFEETDGAFGASATGKFALAAGVIADVKILQQDREPHFENFGIGQT